MNRYSMISVFIVACLLTGATALMAAPFEKEFKVAKVVGPCTIVLPGASAESPAKDGGFYPYGATVKTGRKASLVVVLSEGNEVRVLAETTFVADQNAKDASDKTIRLKEGRIQVKLDPKFHETNKFTVETPSAICGAIGCEFDVSTGVNSTMVLCNDGKVRVAGLWPRWQSILDAGDGISISTAAGTVFMTIRATNGKFDIDYTGGDGQAHSLSLSAGASISLSTSAGRGPSGEPVINITMTITLPDGSTQTVHFWVPWTGPVGPHGQLPESITRLFTSGVTPTQVGRGRGR